jgi:exopolyphosphatase/guanosine-5'-triphosphate,3'-diphosphate pyrophosphatase
LHDVGHVVGRQSHHKLGEYLVRHAELPGLTGPQRNLVACLVRYHSESGPQSDHKVYASLPAAQQRKVLALASLLRIADRLDSDHRQSVSKVKVRTGNHEVDLGLKMRRSSDLVFWNVQRAAALFEEEFGRKVRFKRIS